MCKVGVVGIINNKVVITGGLGFIGSNLAISLARKGSQVTVIDINPRADSLRLHRYERITRENISFKEANIQDKEVLERILRAEGSGGQLFHLAGLAGVRESFVNPTEYFNTNVIGSINVLTSAQNAKVARIFAASSSSVYGQAESTHPMKEKDRIDYPISPYAASKASMEMALGVLASTGEIPISFLRFFTVFGPMGRPDMAAWTFTEKIIKNEEIHVFGGANSYRDFTPVRELVRKLVVLSNLGGKLPPVINLGNSQPVSVLRFIELLGGELGKRPTVTHVDKEVGDVQITNSSTELQKSLGLLSERQSLESGVQDWVKWALENKSLMNIS